jgi:hypothetical protein
MATVKMMILGVMNTKPEAPWRAEEIFLEIRKNLDPKVRAITIERVLYDLVKKGELLKMDKNLYSFGNFRTSLDWLTELQNVG